jgi:uncharacterized membrane protein
MTTPTRSTTPASAPALGRAAAPGQPASLPPRRRGLFWVSVLVALVALIGGGLVAVQAWLSESAPQTSAVAYFRALARGDAPAALALGDVPPGARTYLTREVLRASLTIAKISNVRVLAVDRTGRTATVTLQYQLDYASGPIPVTDAVSTVRQGRSWRLTKTAAPVHLQVPSGRARMSVAGTPVPERAVLFFAGALPVTLDTPNLDLGRQVVHLHGTVPRVLRAGISPAGQRAVEAAISATVGRCARGQTSSDCPQPADQLVVPGSLRGTISGNDLAIAVESDVYGLLHVTGTVTVTGSYQQLDFDNLPVRKSGTLKLSIDAHCYATDPTKVAWGSTA